MIVVSVFVNKTWVAKAMFFQKWWSDAPSTIQPCLLKMIVLGLYGSHRIYIHARALLWTTLSSRNHWNTFEELEFFRNMSTSANTIHTLSKLCKGEEMLISIWQYKKVYLFSLEVTRNYHQINGNYNIMMYQKSC